MMMFFSRNANVSSQPRRRLSFLATILCILSSLALAALSFTQIGGTPVARAASWNQIWGEGFSGSSGTGVNTSNWLYDTGTSYPGGAGNWGTGEVETMSSSTANVYQDGSGHLAINPIRSASGAGLRGALRLSAQISLLLPVARWLFRLHSDAQCYGRCCSRLLASLLVPGSSLPRQL